MKILKRILPVLLALSFTGCLDIYETIEVRPDGSGQYSMDMDMSQMIEIMQTYMGKEELASKGLANMDTTVNMRTIVDTIKSIPEDKRRVLGAGSVRIQLDTGAKVFKTYMKFPYQSQKDLQTLIAGMSDGSLGMTQIMKHLDSQSGAENNLQSTEGPGSSLDQFKNIYDFTSRDGLIEKKLNADKWRALKNDPDIDKMKQAGAMGIEVLYTTTIKVPRPVKKTGNPLAKLSDDKKTVIIKCNLIDSFDHPEQLEYKIEY